MAIRNANPAAAPSASPGAGKNCLALGICLAVALLSNVPVFFFDTIRISEDLALYHQWAAAFHRMIREGVLYPRWMPDTFGGLGDPGFLIAQPLYFYCVSLVQWMGASTWVAMQAVLFVVNAATGFLAYGLCRRVVPFGWAVVAAVAVELAPFVFHVPSFHNTFAWHASMPWMLLVYILTLRAAEGPFRIQVPLAVSVGAMVMMHPTGGLTVLISAPFMYVPRMFRGDLRSILSSGVGWILSCLAGLALAGIYLYPSLTTWNYFFSTNWMVPGWSDYHNSFALSVWTAHHWGFRWFSVQWGIGGVVTACAAVATGLLVAIRKEGRGAAWSTAAGLVAAAWAALFFATEGSFLLWDHVDALRKIEWPYRFLLPATLTGLTALVVATASAWSLGRRRLCAVSASILTASIALNIAYQVTMMRQGGRPDPEKLVAEDFWKTAWVGEHWSEYVRSGGWREECRRSDVQAEDVVGQSHFREWRLRTERPVDIRLPLFAFPAWQVRVNGVVVETGIDPETGLILLRLPRGPNTVSIRWAALPQERIGAGISLAAILLLVGVGVRHRRARNGTWRANNYDC